MGPEPKRLKVTEDQEENFHKLRLNVKGKGLCRPCQKAGGNARPHARARHPRDSKESQSPLQAA